MNNINNMSLTFLIKCTRNQIHCLFHTYYNIHMCIYTRVSCTQYIVQNYLGRTDIKKKVILKITLSTYNYYTKVKEIKTVSMSY